ncbi:MAG: hypothetical protein A4E35_01573 [Methanoregula sp. PtaU1.Bin051]|nr:MAG: hypothetical protein A4E35_01573 [Methanoregula sp. PtaU1.Bin051]
MAPVRSVFALLFLIVCVLLAAGCISQPSAEHPLNTTSTAITNALASTTTMPITEVPTECPVPANGTYWIMIDPIGNVTLGNPVSIEGTTNIPVGYILKVFIFPHSSPHSKWIFKGINGDVTIMRGINCSNVFSSHFDTSAMKAPHLVLVEVYSDDPSLQGYNFTANRSQFYVLTAS